MLYDDGLFYVAHAAQVWGSGASFLIALPVLFVVFVMSALLAAYNDITNKKDTTPALFYKLVSRVYKNRMYQ